VWEADPAAVEQRRDVCRRLVRESDRVREGRQGHPIGIEVRQLVERAQFAILVHLGDRSRDHAISLGSAVAYFVDGARDHGRFAGHISRAATARIQS
jgi:hypothetical protein